MNTLQGARILLGVCLLLLGSISYASDKLNQIMEAKRILIESDILVTARIGYDGAVSDKGWALNYIMTYSTEPDRDFMEIFNHSVSVYGKIYSIIAILEKKYENHYALIDAIKIQNIKIIMKNGDIVDWYNIDDIIELISFEETRQRLFIIDKELLEGARPRKTNGRVFRELEKMMDAELPKIHDDGNRKSSN